MQTTGVFSLDRSSSKGRSPDYQRRKRLELKPRRTKNDRRQLRRDMAEAQRLPSLLCSRFERQNFLTGKLVEYGDRHEGSAGLVALVGGDDNASLVIGSGCDWEDFRDGLRPAGGGHLRCTD